MAWNPEVYNKFKKERYAPFDDLVSLIKIKPRMQVIDLGCGTGELTKKLAAHLPGSAVLGIDSSPEMLQQARALITEQLTFQHRSIGDTIALGESYDLVFSHAAIQWLDHHETLLPQLMALVRNGGQLAIQLPSNHDHYTHRLLHNMALTEPYQTAFGGWMRQVSTLSIEHYAQLLFDNGSTDITVYEKAYPHVLENADALFSWMSGTALIRYLEKLPAALQQKFTADYKKQLNEKYTSPPVFYPFKRIIMAASF